MATKTCRTCHKDVDALAIFPGGVCVDCYSQTAEGRRMPTAEEVTATWSGKRVRRV